MIIVWTMMAAFMGSAITWWVALYGAPTNYEKHKAALEQEAKETKSMKAWNKRQMKKGKGGKR